MALIDKVRVIKLLLFALFMMVSMVTPAQSQVDWSIKAGIGMANIIGDNMGSPKVKLAYKLGIGLENKRFCRRLLPKRHVWLRPGTLD